MKLHCGGTLKNEIPEGNQNARRGNLENWRKLLV